MTVTPLNATGEIDLVSPKKITKKEYDVLKGLYVQLEE
jgi:hypothetical protein